MANKYLISSAFLAHSYIWLLLEIIEIIKKYKQKRLLDLGCGNGSLVKYLISNFNIDCLGIDPSKEEITFTKEGRLVIDVALGGLRVTILRAYVTDKLVENPV